MGADDAHSGVALEGPVWWLDDDEGTTESWGLFPLATTSDDFHQVGPVFWSGEESGSDWLVALPLFGYEDREDGSGLFLSLLGGRGRSADGEHAWVNVLGPVYHRSVAAGASSTHVLWPIGHWSDGPERSSWGLWPLVGGDTEKASEHGPESVRSWALLGLVEGVRGELATKLRVAPLFSHATGYDHERDLLDWLTLYGYQRHDDGSRDLHVGTPLVFHHARDGDAVAWSSLLGALDYETDGTDSSFDLLWYLYRQHTTDGVTRRDLFPFVTWDSGTSRSTGEDRTEFSFLWRLLHYERRGDRRGGHFLFFPWGVTD